MDKIWRPLSRFYLKATSALRINIKNGQGAVFSLIEYIPLTYPPLVTDNRLHQAKSLMG